MKETQRYMPRHISGNKKIHNIPFRKFIIFFIVFFIYGLITLFTMSLMTIGLYGTLFTFFWFGLMDIDRESGFSHMHEFFSNFKKPATIWEGKNSKERTSVFVRTNQKGDSNENNSL
ncbi:MAG: hypothetical protein Q8N88_03640 [Nanoarchaeota archaeon]|nr:hypothetical protein [Nanoarchaeota archaeon]